MGPHMKTTVEIADSLLREAKRVAEQNGITFRELLEEALRRLLANRKQPAQPFKLADGSVGGKGLHPDIRPGDWAQLRGLVYEGHGE